ncbi:MAG: T9SS type A sorting domain-containing protein [Bacteroidales bacterium]|nr:T9SS type A sorting domain-containing protein [Bacteroidales bacterium]
MRKRKENFIVMAAHLGSALLLNQYNGNKEKADYCPAFPLQNRERFNRPAFTGFIKTSFSRILVLTSMIFIAAQAVSQPGSFDGDKPVFAYDTFYSQEFNPTAGWDRFRFYGQWSTLMPNIFFAADISDGYLKFKWIEKRVICSREKYEQPYIFQADYDYATASNRAGMVIRIQSKTESIQEPESDPGFNREGIAFYPSKDGNYMIVQFSGEDLGYASGMAFTRIKVPKPEGVANLYDRAILRIEDFGTTIYIYHNGTPFIRIDFDPLVGELYTSGRVYDANVLEVGSFNGMEVEASGLVAFATRDAAPRLYGTSIHYNEYSKPDEQPIFPSSPRDLRTDTWVATDDLGRTLPGYEEVGPVKDDHRRVVGIFYITWHTEDHYTNFKSPFSADVTKILAADPNARLDADHPLWNRPTISYHWGEPELGYFLSQDEFVIRRDMAMLANAGVDVLVMDVTNAVSYWDEWEVLFSTMKKMKAEGNHVPKFCFWAFNGPVISVVQDLYDWFYRSELYKDLWFYWEGKPLLLYNANPDPLYNNPNPYYDPDAVTNPDNPNFGDPYYTEEFYTDYTQEVKDFFTNRNMWWGYYEWPVGSGTRYVGTEDNWSFGYDLHNENVKVLEPDELIATHNGINEQAAVCPAQHPLSMVGKSWRRETGEPVLNKYDMPVSAYVPWLDQTVTNPEAYGIYFQDRWEEAIASDPHFLYINDWNEWSAGKFHPETGTFPFMNRNSPFYFVDQYNAEFNRAIQPMKDGYRDNYYMQMVQNIRRYKGIREHKLQVGTSDISVDQAFSDWEQVENEFLDAIGDARHRNHNGYGGLHYSNETGRNDIMSSKVAYDNDSLYFYVKTVYDITAPDDSNWMLLFIDADRRNGTGWEGYDYVVNRGEKTASRTTLLKWNGLDWGNPISIPYCREGNQMEISILKADLLLSAEIPEFYFKWADNPQHLEDISCFFNDGDAAPDRRFGYSFSTTAVNVVEQSPYKELNIPGIIELEDFDLGSAGVAYVDVSLGNSGGAYRTDVSADIASKGENEFYLTEIASGEWLEYTVNVNSIGIFSVDLTYAADSADQTISLLINDRPLYEELLLPETGSKESWDTANFEVILNSGKQVLRVLAESVTGGLVLDKFVFTGKAVVQPGSGTGLYRTLYNGMAGGRGWFTDSLCSEVDPVLDHEWAEGESPGCGANTSFWNAKWQGYIEPLFSEEYALSLTLNDKARMWIEGELLFDAFNENHSNQTLDVKLELSAGEKTPLILDYANAQGDGKIKLEWESPSQRREVISQKQLYPKNFTTTGMYPKKAFVPFIYPNPANQLLHIEVPAGTSVEILTMSGKVVFNASLESGTTGFNVSGWNAGLYIVRLRNVAGIITRKLIIE